MQEIRKLNIDELMQKIDDSRKEHMDLRFKKASMQLNDSTEVRKPYRKQWQVLALF